MTASRERWASRPAFIMAAIGSAIGLGNVWRFPGVAFNNGGGAFFVPYFIALLTAGIPLMIVEYGMGSKFQGSAPLAYRKLGKKYEWIGWWTVLIGLFISFYYCVLLAWSWEYVWECLRGMFGDGLPWDKGQAGAYFGKEIAEVSADPGTIGSLNVPALIGLALTWVAIYFSIAGGAHRVGKVVMITVPLPLLLLLGLAIRGMTLEGASDGIAYYLAPEWDKLLDPGTWVAAYGQVFFSLSVGWGILIAYASFRPKGSDVVNNAYITSFGNCAFSFLAGFAVFSTMGYLAVASSQPLGDVNVSSFGLAFTSYPTAVENIGWGPGGQAFMAFAFFLMLLTLGIDSAFSIVEAVATALRDKFQTPRQVVVISLCVLGFAVGSIFCFGWGLYLLDILDKFMSDWGLAFVALVQCVVIAWLIPRATFKELEDNINERSEFKVGAFWRFCLRIMTPVVLGVVFVLAALKLFDRGYEGYDTKYLIWYGAIPAALAILGGFAMQAMKWRSKKGGDHADA